MCRTDYDEAWDVVQTWPGQGKCVDCGHVGPVAYEELAVVDGEGAAVDVDIFLNDGVPDWRSDAENEAYDLALDAEGSWWAVVTNIADTQPICDNCAEARRWLSTWCRSFMYGDYLSDIVEHWDEAEIERSLPFGRLAVAAKNRWTIRGRRLTSAEVAGIVDRSLADLQARTGMSHAA